MDKSDENSCGTYWCHQCNGRLCWISSGWTAIVSVLQPEQRPTQRRCGMDDMPDWEWMCSHDPDQTFDWTDPEALLSSSEVLDPRLRMSAVFLVWLLVWVIFFVLTMPGGGNLPR